MRKIFIIIAVVFISSSIYSQGNFDGFGNVKWGSSLNDVKSSIIGKIVFTDEEKILVSRDGDIEYLYGFFFRGIETGTLEPAEAVPMQQNDNTAEKPAEPAAKTAESDIKAKDSKLFYVAVKFPYLSKDDVKKKLEEKYGPSTGEDIKDNKGAIVWNSGTTTIVMWVDSYEKKPYCMKINYISKDIAKEVKDYLNVMFNSREIEVLKKLSL